MFGGPNSGSFQTGLLSTIVVLSVGCLEIPPAPVALVADVDSSEDIPDTQTPSCAETCQTYCVAEVCATVEQFVGGQHHLCATMSDGQRFCWGRANQGSLGDNGASAAIAPSRIDIPDQASVALGNVHTCWLDSQTVRCMGNNILHQCGHDDPDLNLTAPHTVPMPQDIEIEQISAGGENTCVITTTGEPLCWGRDINGQSWQGGPENGTGHPDPRTLVGWSGERVLEIAVGGYSACVRLADGIQCLGNGASGALGRGSFNDAASLIDVKGIGTVESLWPGSHHYCALSNSGTTLHCWGNNQWGQSSGLPGDEYNLLPVDRSDWFERPLVAVYPGWRATCASDVDGRLFCWGLNTDGILGVPGPGLVLAPIELPDRRGAAFFSGSRGCISTDTDVACWGANDVGQVGSGFVGPNIVAEPIVLNFNPI